MTDTRDLAKMATALLTSLLLVAAVTSFVLPGRPSPAVIKAFFSGLAGAIAAVVGQTSTNTPTNAGNAAVGTGNVNLNSAVQPHYALPIPTQNTPNQYVTGFRGVQ